MYVLPACIFVYHTCVPNAHRDQKKVSNPSELMLKTVVSHQVGTGTQTQSPERAASDPNH